jgi:dihydropyrimidinase
MDESLKKVMPLHLQSAQNRLLIKNGTVVNSDGSKIVDVYIEDSIIKQIGNHLIIPGGSRTIDAYGKLVIPGGIDPSVHFQTPVGTEGTTVPNGTRTIDDFYVGTKAALAGGTTTVIDLIQPETGESLLKGKYLLHNCLGNWIRAQKYIVKQYRKKEKIN